MQTKIIELKDYLPQTPALEPDTCERRNAVRFRSADVLSAVETAVTAAIGVCMLISTAMMFFII